MLKLNHKAMRGTDISDVLFPGLPIVLDKLLAFGREVVFPRAVPAGFLLVHISCRKTHLGSEEIG
ncbi:hypothetical protein [Bradyrhizobium sp. LCT2]|uniref:hypothetical protein n=1 Tax=Bradyrhizobium sp. LCT2 TaxID=2493093 RepID=UPI001374A963|nr:hypothetical protein [Bradyrhizobium sp. LCT2]